MAAGSVFGAIFVVPWVRARLSANLLIVIANLMIAVVYLLMAFVRDQAAFMLVAAAAGIGWTLSASELWVAAQRAMPSWSRGRMNATVIMVSQGAMALGGVVWGAAAAVLGLHPTLIGGAILLSISLILAIPLSINFTRKLDFDPGSVTSFSQTSFSHKLIALPQPQDGPVAITYEFEVDRVREDEFMETDETGAADSSAKRCVQLATARRSDPVQHLPCRNDSTVLDSICIATRPDDESREKYHRASKKFTYWTRSDTGGDFSLREQGTG
jgi:hypothetical protein